MTVYEDEIEVRRPSVGTKVLVLACAIMAVLGSFWGIVWFIRAYVEPPRVMAPAALVLAARESVPVPPPPASAQQAAESQTADPRPAPFAAQAQALPAQPAARSQAAPPAASAAPREAADQPSASSAVADRWAPMNQFQPAPAPAAAPAASSPPSADAQAATDPDDVIEGSVPAFDGPAPLPRRRPMMTASAKRSDPPLPRPRPDGQTAPSSVWIAAPTSDDRYQAGQ